MESARPGTVIERSAGRTFVDERSAGSGLRGALAVEREVGWQVQRLSADFVRSTSKSREVCWHTLVRSVGRNRDVGWQR